MEKKLTKRDAMLALKEKGYDFYCKVEVTCVLKGVNSMREALDVINDKVGSMIDDKWGHINLVGNVTSLHAIKPRKGAAKGEK